MRNSRLPALSVGLLALSWASCGLASPARDGSVATAIFSSTNTQNVAVTSTGTSGDVLCWVGSENGTGQTISTMTSAGLTFAKRTAQSVATHGVGFELWWAAYSSKLTAASVTVTMTGTIDDATFNCQPYSGAANTAAPFDANVALPAVQTSATSVAGNPTYSTTSPNDLILALSTGWKAGSPCAFSTSSWTSIANTGNTGAVFAVCTSSFDTAVSSTQSGATSSISSPGLGAGEIIIVDALAGPGGGAASTPLRSLLGVGQ